MDLAHLRTEIESRRGQIERQPAGDRDLQMAGISTAAAEALLDRMLAKDELCLERDRKAAEERRKYPGTDKVINGPIERRYR
jgi:hypothetical protein